MHSTNETKNLLGICSQGIISPNLAKRIGTKLPLGIFEEKKGKVWTSEVNSNINLFHGRAFVIISPAIERKVHYRTDRGTLIKHRISPKEIVAIRLPYALPQQEAELTKWVARLKKFSKPIYDFDGSLIWPKNN